MAKPPKKAVNTAKAMYDAHWKADSTNWANEISKNSPIMKRQIQSGDESSIDSARATMAKSLKNASSIIMKYPDKDLLGISGKKNKDVKVYKD